MTSSSGQGTAARTHSLAPEHLGEVQAGAALTIAILGVAIFIAGIGVVVGGLTAAGSFDPANPPPGCHFHPRCPYARDICREKAPVQQEIAPHHFVSCHRAAELTLRGVARGGMIRER